MKRKDDIYRLEYKREWNFAAKFYFVCFIIFVVFVAYIMIYRHTHKAEIINNMIESNQVTREEVEETLNNMVENDQITQKEADKILNNE